MADTPESFSWSKWFAGFFNGVSWAKDFKTIIVIVILVLAGYTVYRAYIMPRQNQNQRQIINVQKGAVSPGGTLNLSTPQSQMQTSPKNHWSTGPFVGAFGNKDDHAYFAGWILLYNF